MDFLSKSKSTAAYFARTANSYITKPLLLNICFLCNNLSPYRHHASSDKSQGFFDDTTAQDRASLSSGAVWLNLDVSLRMLLRSRRKRRNRPCHYCEVLLSVSKNYFPELFRDGDVDPNIADDRATVGLMLASDRPVQVKYWDKVVEISARVTTSEIVEETGNDVDFLTHCPPLAFRSQRSDAPEAWDFVLKAKSNCDAHHEGCRGSTSITALPKRVVDVSMEESMIRLYEPESHGRGSYVALSHCWGKGDSPVRTLLNNLEKHKAGIDLHELNQTFIDAVQIARRLEFKYIWIDSLCIIQDSPKDWEDQAAKMADIYQNASITIALGSSSGPSQSIFRERNDEWQAQDFYEAFTDDGTYMLKARRQALPTTHYPLRGEGWNFAESLQRATTDSSVFAQRWNGPLYFRAWCMQEQMLSKRMLHYTEGAIVWECRSERQVEGEAAIKKSQLDDHESKPTETAMSWKDIVMNYTSRGITRTTDRLIALAGVAAERASRTNDVYIAGLWKSTMFWDLLWNPEVFAEVEPTKCGAPSWSWASVSGKVAFNEHPSGANVTTYATVEDVSATPKSVNSPFADVASASVTIHGPIVQARLFFGAHSTRFLVYAPWESPEDGDYILPDTRIYEADGLLEDGSLIKSCRRAKPSEDCTRQCSGLDEEPVTVGFEVTILCFLHSKALDVCGLVLGRSTDTPGAYTRVAQCFKLPLKYVKKGEMKSITIV